jgi:predicted alpha/beta-hydrolase family hydrolase
LLACFRQPRADMAIGGFVEGPAAAGADYGGRVTSFVVLSCIVAGSGGILFGYDLGISGSYYLN